MNKDKKTLVKFIAIMVISAIIGGIVGYTGADAGKSSLEMFNMVQSFLVKISPVIMAVALAVTVKAILDLSKSKKLVEKAMSTQEEEDFDKATKALESSLSNSAYCMIAAYFAFGIVISGLFKDYDMSNLTVMIIQTVIFVIISIIATAVQSKAVKLDKVMAPEKKGNPLDFKFHKEYYDSCDEAEKELIGRASYKSYVATTIAIIIATLICFVMSAFTPIGAIPSMLLIGVWLVQTYTFLKESKKNQR